MILIADNTDRKIRREIREWLFSLSIPCAVADTDRIDAYLPAGAVVVTEKYLLSEVEYMASLHEPSPIELYDESAAFSEFIMDVYDRHCRERCEGMGYRRLSCCDGEFLFFNKSVSMTKTEKRILRMLLFSRDWESGERLSLYCLKKQKPDLKSIAVHICNLNKKMNAACGFDMIEHRRFSGYRINNKAL
ncbi:MAG: helix-turn-helix domain-containing protein [Ruminococcaceae bacterium]|nr:helix-turn-helix domain-containing protein [Oscillospiraceae bacterium]